ncbi:MAG TPA: response regulator [Bacteroidales bacterium]|nr:response regulator [Bacteroidales bacterium]HRX98043.1 response regulator [Bacteroidales bacterium]
MVRPETIFVVEDDLLYLTLITKELEKMGYTNIISNNTGKEAIHNLDKKPDIALLDYFLEKDFTGMDVLKKIKKRFPETQVIFLTASDDVNIAVDTMRNGAYDYIVKGDTAFIRIRHLLKKISEENERKAKSRSIIRFQIYVIIAIILISLLGILYFHYFIN